MLVILSSLSVTGQTSNIIPATLAVVPQPLVQMSETAPCCLLLHAEWINLIYQLIYELTFSYWSKLPMSSPKLVEILKTLRSNEQQMLSYYLYR